MRFSQRPGGVGGRLAAGIVLVLTLVSGPVLAQGAAQAPQHAPAGDAFLMTRDPTKLVFPRAYWEPEHRGYLPMVEFLQGDWEKRIKLAPPPSSSAQILEEIRYLHSLMSLREELKEEIRAQATSSILPYFFPLLMMTTSSHPRTMELLTFTNLMGALVYPYKHHFNRARPSQLSPSLNPMIQVPGHPAYPSGHGFQSWLGAIALAEVRPDARPMLLEMAQRIGKNREIAGVHFPSDTKAGQSLADQAFAIARQGQHLREMLAEAKAEWR